eukprot:10799523-Alexandrium_andersonii.AAC.1
MAPKRQKQQRTRKLRIKPAAGSLKKNLGASNAFESNCAFLSLWPTDVYGLPNWPSEFLDRLSNADKLGQLMATL